MLKYAFLASGMLLASPLLAQDKIDPAAPAPAEKSAPVKSVDPVQTAPSTPAAGPDAATRAQDPVATPGAMTAQTDPAKPVSSAAPVPAEQAAQPAVPAGSAQPAPAQQAVRPASGQQVAQIVNTEFASYDRDKNGTLNEQEFGAWMVALKTAADPSTRADAPATKVWMTQAFAQADTDKNKAVSKAELTGFLSAGQG
jgi:hypothetical protein